MQKTRPQKGGAKLTPFNIIPIALLTLMTVWYVVMAFQVVVEHRLYRRAIRTEAVVTDVQIEQYSGGESGRHHIVFVQFYDCDGNEVTQTINYRFPGRTFRNSGLSVGGTAIIYYDPQNIEYVSHESTRYAQTVFTAAVGGMSLILYIPVMILMLCIIRNRKLRKRLIENDRFVMADVTAFGERAIMAVNRRDIIVWDVECEYKDVHKTYEFSAKGVLCDFSRNITADNKIRVYVDGKDFSKYYIDIDIDD